MTTGTPRSVTPTTIKKLQGQTMSLERWTWWDRTPGTATKVASKTLRDGMADSSGMPVFMLPDVVGQTARNVVGQSQKRAPGTASKVRQGQSKNRPVFAQGHRSCRALSVALLRSSLGGGSKKGRPMVDNTTDGASGSTETPTRNRILVMSRR